MSRGMEKARGRSHEIVLLAEKPGFRFHRGTNRIVADDCTWQKYMKVRSEHSLGVVVLRLTKKIAPNASFSPTKWKGKSFPWLSDIKEILQPLIQTMRMTPKITMMNSHSFNEAQRNRQLPPKLDRAPKQSLPSEEDLRVQLKIVDAL